MKKQKRGRIFVDRKAQGTLLLRVFTYWVCSVTVIALTTLFVTYMTRRHIDTQVILRQTLSQFGPTLIATLLLLPVLLLDALRLSNRFAGPLVRLRGQWRKLAQGEDVKPIGFRDDDFWNGLANEFNDVREYILELRHECEVLRESLAAAGGFPRSADAERDGSTIMKTNSPDSPDPEPDRLLVEETGAAAGGT